MSEKCIYNYETVAKLYEVKLNLTDIIHDMRNDVDNSYKMKNLAMLEYYNQLLGDLLVDFKKED